MFLPKRDRRESRRREREREAEGRDSSVPRSARVAQLSRWSSAAASRDKELK